MASPGYRRCPQDTAYPQDTDSILRIPRYPQDTAGVLRYKCLQDASGILRIPCPQDAPRVRVPGSTPTLAFSDVRRGSLYHSLSLSRERAHAASRPLGSSVTGPPTKRIPSTTLPSVVVPPLHGVRHCGDGLPTSLPVGKADRLTAWSPSPRGDCAWGAAAPSGRPRARRPSGRCPFLPARHRGWRRACPAA